MFKEESGPKLVTLCAAFKVNLPALKKVIA
jgi:hypothetical protein